MRVILTGLALVALCSPAIGQDCRFYNATGQSIDFRPKESAMTLYPAYDDSKYECRILGPQRGNAYGVACDDGPGHLVIGMSEPDKPFVDILVFDDIFFWLKCKETT